jgi:DNA-binding GntR family transcriptional regulator
MSTRALASPATYPTLVKNAIKERIQNGALQPGQWIRQDELAAQLGVSRIPVREALQSLAGEGLVKLLAHRGAQVSPVSLEALDEIESLRDFLESNALRRAATHRDDSVLATATDALVDMNQSLSRDRREDFYPANERFHFAMFDSAGSSLLSTIIRTLWASWIPYRGIFYVNRPADFAQLQKEHRAMLRALKSGDGTRLVQLQHEHRAAAVKYVRRDLERSVSKSRKRPTLE